MVVIGRGCIGCRAFPQDRWCKVSDEIKGGNGKIPLRLCIGDGPPNGPAILNIRPKESIYGRADFSARDSVHFCEGGMLFSHCTFAPEVPSFGAFENDLPLSLCF
jgi:hypothetical protein